MNLLPKEMRPVQKRWQHAPLVALLVVNALLLTALLARGPIQRQIMLRQYQRDIANVDARATLVERQVAKQQRVGQKLDELRGFQEQGRKPLDALSNVAQKLPTDAWIAAFNCKQGQVDITGTAKSASSVLPALKSVPDFQDVQFAGGLLREAEGAERFHIQMKLRTQ